MYKTDYERSLDQASILLIQTLTDKIKKLMAEDVKSLYITLQGRAAVDEACMKHGRDTMEKTPIVYHPPKADRVGRINEALLLFHQADLGDKYYTSRDVKGDMEKDHRGGDQLKYSRFVGIWKKADDCSMVYHFGRKNIQLNRNGEKNARQVAKFFHHKVERLILGDNMDYPAFILLPSLYGCQDNAALCGQLLLCQLHLLTILLELLASIFGNKDMIGITAKIFILSADSSNLNKYIHLHVFFENLSIFIAKQSCPVNSQPGGEILLTDTGLQPCIAKLVRNRFKGAGTQLHSDAQALGSQYFLLPYQRRVNLI